MAPGTKWLKIIKSSSELGLYHLRFVTTLNVIFFFCVLTVFLSESRFVFAALLYHDFSHSIRKAQTIKPSPLFHKFNCYRVFPSAFSCRTRSRKSKNFSSGMWKIRKTRFFKTIFFEFQIFHEIQCFLNACFLNQNWEMFSESKFLKVEPSDRELKRALKIRAKK